MERTTWSGRLMFIITLAGATIGYGAAWRFPYLVGEYGGGAFLLIFFTVMVLFGLPIIVGETLLGRRKHTNVIDSFSGVTAANKPINKNWKLVGYLSILGAFGIMSYYVVISSWVIHYLVGIVSGGLSLSSPLSIAQTTSFYNSGISNPWLIVLYSLIFIGANYFILVKGIRGIEKSMKYLMPALLIIVVLMAIRGVTLPGALEGIKFYTVPDFSKITSKTLIAALGQVFFGLSLGFGVMVTLGSYLKKNENIVFTSFSAIMINIFVPFLIGFIIFPPMFAFGLSPAEGPSLVFKVLPMIFSHMPAGRWVGLAFFTLVFLDALTTAITIYEVAITSLTEKTKIKRKQAICISLMVVFILGNIPCILGFNLWKDVGFLGKNIFDMFDYVSANILLILTSLFTAIFIGFVLNKSAMVEELTNNATINNKLAIVCFYYLKYVIPFLIVLVFILNI